MTSPSINTKSYLLNTRNPLRAVRFLGDSSGKITLELPPIVTTATRIANCDIDPYLFGTICDNIIEEKNGTIETEMLVDFNLLTWAGDNRLSVRGTYWTEGLRLGFSWLKDAADEDGWAHLSMTLHWEDLRVLLNLRLLTNAPLVLDVPVFGL